mgnify:CR=1 FL=1
MAKKTTSKKKTTPKKKPVKRSTGQKIFRFVWKTFLWFNIVSVFLVLLYKFVPVPYTPLMAIRALEQKEAGKEIGIKNDGVAPVKIEAKVSSEVELDK